MYFVYLSFFINQDMKTKNATEQGSIDISTATRLEYQGKYIDFNQALVSYGQLST